MIYPEGRMDLAGILISSVELSKKREVAFAVSAALFGSLVIALWRV